MQAQVESFFHEDSCTFSYVVSDPVTRRAAIIDPVLDYDAAAGRTATTTADRVAAHVEAAGLELDWILETHAHADHLSAARYLQRRLGGSTAIGSGIESVQKTFKDVFSLEPEFPTDGSQFDHLFADEEALTLGELSGQVLATPGHTSDSVTYLIGDAAFVGDTLFMPDSGTARCDFPGGDARILYRSIRRIFTLPPDTRLFLCHDYAPGGREFLNQTSIADQRTSNIHVRDGVSEDEFVTLRQTRDETLEVPRLLLPAVQVNIRAGDLPPPEGNGISYLKIPLNAM